MVDRGIREKALSRVNTSIKILMMRWFPASVGMNDKWVVRFESRENYKLKGLERGIKRCQLRMLINTFTQLLK